MNREAYNKIIAGIDDKKKDGLVVKCNKIIDKGLAMLGCDTIDYLIDHFNEFYEMLVAQSGWTEGTRQQYLSAFKNVFETTEGLKGKLTEEVKQKCHSVSVPKKKGQNMVVIEKAPSEVSFIEVATETSDDAESSNTLEFLKEVEELVIEVQHLRKELSYHRDIIVDLLKRSGQDLTVKFFEDLIKNLRRN